MRKPFLAALAVAAVALGVNAVASAQVSPPYPPGGPSTTVPGDEGWCDVFLVPEDKVDHLDLLVDCRLSDTLSRAFRGRLDEETLLRIAQFVEENNIGDGDNDDEFVVQ